jgi:4,5-dihydroxyphthalate decarboxylase
MLQDDYGVGAEYISWHQGGLNSPGRRPPFALALPDRIKLTPLPEGKALSTMLAEGELDGIITARAPSCFDEGHPRVRRLFPDYREVEAEYFRRHRVFPIMHVVGIRRAVAEQNVELPLRLLKAFSEAKRIAENDLREVTALKVGLPWAPSELEATERLMGRDFWPYGVEANRKTLETAVRYSVEQGITPRPIAVEDMFAPTTLR